MRNSDASARRIPLSKTFYNDPEARWNDSQFISSFIGNITLFRVDFAWISSVKFSEIFDTNNENLPNSKSIVTKDRSNSRSNKSSHLNIVPAATDIALKSQN